MSKRILAVGALAALLLPLASVAGAATKKKITYEFGSDRKSWFWQRQINEQVGGPEAPGGVTHRVFLPSPQSPDTLPVAVENGEPQKVSSIYFDIASRGVEAGSTITKFVLSIEESTAGGEHPSINAEGKKIRACPVEEFWPSGEAEKWNGQPEHDDSACMTGKRSEKGDTVRWTFNLLPMADPWGEDPSGAYHGVMLVPVVAGSGPSETWQINLKIPARDDEATPDDESKQTRNRASVEIAFEPPPPSDDALGGFSGLTDSGTSSLSSPSTSFSGSTTPSTSFTPTTSTSTGTDSPSEETTDQIHAAPVSGRGTDPVMPPVVWALIPTVLLGIAAVRSVVMEPVGGPRADGAIAAIRRLNARARGVSPEDAPVPPYMRFVTGLREKLRGAPAKVGDRLTRITKRLTRR